MAAGVVIGIIAGTAGHAGAQTVPQLEPQLPDLVEATPSRISIVAQRAQGRLHWRLIFRSSAENRGFADNGGGHLIVVGHRPSRRTPFMTADQYVDMFDPQTGDFPTQTVYRDVGRLRFMRSSDHEHWHLLGFERYELRRASDYSRVARDRKTGFCLGNRYAVKPARAARVGYRDFDPHCGLKRPRLKKVIEGISAGWGDDYKPLLEGQFVDVTDIASGRYVLVHRVNARHALHESDYTNNAASVLLRIARPGTGAPTLRIVRRCPGEERCPPSLAG
jgi:hypothetical protein